MSAADVLLEMAAEFEGSATAAAERAKMCVRNADRAPTSDKASQAALMAQRAEQDAAFYTRRAEALRAGAAALQGQPASEAA